MSSRNVGSYYFYKTKDKLGEGNYGTVYKGLHKYDKTEVAIKEIRMNYDIKYLEQEMKILEKLSELNHPNLIKLFRSVPEAGFIYLVTDYCNYGDLGEYLSLKHTLDTETIQLFFKQIADGIEVIHAQHIVHRDLKPQNILLCVPENIEYVRTSDITLKIGDFGIGRYLGPHEFATSFIGSPRYMAPEVVLEKRYDQKVDLWSIGVMFYECVIGDVPFLDKITTMKLLKSFYEKGELKIVLPDGTPNRFRDLLSKLLQIEPEKRANLHEFVHHAFFDLDRDTILVPPSKQTPKVMGENPEWVEVIHPMLPIKEDDLELKQGNIIRVIEKREDGWLKGELNGEVGWFPSMFVRKSEPPNENTEGMDELKNTIIIKSSNDIPEPVVTQNQSNDILSQPLSETTLKPELLPIAERVKLFEDQKKRAKLLENLNKEHVKENNKISGASPKEVALKQEKNVSPPPTHEESNRKIENLPHILDDKQDVKKATEEQLHLLKQMNAELESRNADLADENRASLSKIEALSQYVEELERKISSLYKTEIHRTIEVVNGLNKQIAFYEKELSEHKGNAKKFKSEFEAVES